MMKRGCQKGHKIELMLKKTGHSGSRSARKLALILVDPSAYHYWWTWCVGAGKPFLRLEGLRNHYDSPLETVDV